MAKEFFTKNNVAYEDLNVGTDLKAREEMVAKSHQLGVPVIDIDGTIVVGFDQKKVEALLGLGSK
jgi:glutaredoxin